MNPLQTLSKEQIFQPAIMQSISLQNACTCHKNIYYSHVNSNCLTMENNTTANNYCTKCCNNNIKSFLLLDEYENLTVTDVEQFLEKLNCTNTNVKVKVISIIGNTGDEKNHVINRIFFKDLEIFTMDDQNSCTLGVWAAFDPIHNVICLNTKGITMYDENKCTKLLLKILAISDVVIYRTYSVNLNSNLFKFLSGASSAYNYYFQAALKAIAQREKVPNPLSSFGPSVLVLHETKYSSTTPNLAKDKPKVTEDSLRVKFARMKLNTEAFSSIKYVVLEGNHSIDYELVRSTIRIELNDITVRSARKPNLIYNILKTLNDKFPDRESLSIILFPDQYFTCPAKCLSCESICTSTMGHLREGNPHTNNNKCQYQHQYGNVKYICMKCYDKGNIVEVNNRFQAQNESSWYSIARYAWSGYIIECPDCGEIYRSRQYWYGNQNPEDIAVCTEIKHVWNMQNNILSQNTAQRVVDSVSYITEAVTNVSLQPTKALSSWVADQVAPSYWRPNHEIKECHNCEISFSPTDTKHHCRDCGEGFCELCTSQTKCVPSRNWYTPVRVCALCYAKDANSNDNRVESIDDISIRKMTEQVVSTFNIVGTVLNYSKSLIKDSIRPSYWIPDSEITNCCVCYQKFSEMLPLHHCRDCGHGVCQECSQNRKPVVYRGWEKPVRVCDTCFNTD